MAQTSRAVIVAVDAAGSAHDAVEWAAAEADARGLPLRIVHVISAPHAVGLDGLDVATEQSLAARAMAEEVLYVAALRACSVVADLAVTTDVLRGPAASSLEQVGHGAPLLVLGSRRRGTLRRLVGGSVSGHVAACTPCPAVIVRHQERVPGVAPTVVAGVVPGARGFAAVEFAFHAAWQRRIPLTLVHVVAADPALHPPGLAIVGPDAIRDPAVINAIRTWRRQFSGVDLRINGFVGDPATILLRESAGAALLVLGSAGGRRRGVRDIRSIGQRVLPKARCPVAVVGHDAVSATTATVQLRDHPERPAAPR